MNRIAFTFAVAATVMAAAPLAAQGRGRNIDGVPPGHRPPAGMCRIWIDGVPPGRQPYGVMSCAEAEARRPSGARVIYGSSDRSSGIYDRNGDGRIDSRDDVYDRNGDGRIDSRDRTNCAWWDLNCTNNTRTGTNGSWQVAGRDSNGQTIYVRRRVDSNGNVIIERARRNSLGQMVVIDRQVQGRGSRSSGGKYDRVLNGRDDNDDYYDNEDGQWDRRDRDDRAYDRTYSNGRGKGKYKSKGRKNH